MAYPGIAQNIVPDAVPNNILDVAIQPISPQKVSQNSMLITKTMFTRATRLGLVIGLIGIIISLSPLGLVLEENVGLDQLFMFRGQRPAPTDVVIVSIDKDSARNLNLAKELVKWPRALHARLIDRLTARGARVIGFDVLFKEHRSPAEDNQLAHSIQQANNIVLFQYLDKQIIAVNGQSIHSQDPTIIETLVPPIPLLAESAVALAPFALPKVPAKVSQIWMFKPSAGDTPTLPAVMFQIYAYQVYAEFRRVLLKLEPGVSDILPVSHESILQARNTSEVMMKLHSLFMDKPTLTKQFTDLLDNEPGISADKKNLLSALARLYSSNNSQYLNFYGPARSLTTIAFSTIVNLPEQPQDSDVATADDFDFSGKAIFVGLSEPIQLERVDTFYTPFSQANGVDISGIEIGATAFANLLENVPVQPLTILSLISLLFAWGLLMGLSGSVNSTLFSIMSYAGLSGVYLAGSYYLFNTSALWLPVIVPLLIQMPVALFASIFWKYLDTNKDRKKIRDAFGYYLPDNIVDDIANNLSLGKTSHQLNVGTCLATDAEQYTALSEKMAPNALGSLMNRYYETLFNPVKQHKGFVSDIIGDAMMAIWTSPASDIQHRQQACFAAIEMKQSVASFNQQTDHPELPTRIGVHSGELLLGNIGAVNHYEYRAVGDTVNTASRIQGLNKQLGTYLLVSDEVLVNLDDFLTRKLGKFLLVGKTKPIVIHELINLKNSATDKEKSLCNAFSSAMQLFDSQDWAAAKEKFEQCHNEYNQDGPCGYFMTLCQSYLQHPPEPDEAHIIRINKK